MRRRSTAMKAGLILLGVTLTVGFVEILEKRFVEGGIYPHYASYRSDPLGTSVLYESLAGLGTLQVSRNLTDLNTIRGLDGDSTLLLLGYPRDGFEDLRAPESSPVMKAVEEGARLVLTINPELVPEAFRPGLSETEEDWIDRRRRIREERARREAAEPGEAKQDGAKESSKENTGTKTNVSESGTETPEPEPEDTGKAEKDGEEEDEEERRLEKEMEALMGLRLTEKLGFEVANSTDFERPEEGWETAPGQTFAVGGVPAELPVWRSQYRFETNDAAWRTVVLAEEKPVVIERTFGKGTIVLASDTYFASNESLHLGAEPGFLLWLIGGKAKIVFDETIHGTVESGGAMKLIRRHRAHGVFLGLIAFLILWAWRSACPLVPGSEDLERGLVGGEGTVMGEATGSGLIRLLRRSVPPANLLTQCVEIWKGSAATGIPGEAKAGVARLLDRHRLDPRHHGAIETYRAIADLIRKR